MTARVGSLEGMGAEAEGKGTSGEVGASAGSPRSTVPHILWGLPLFSLGLNSSSRPLPHHHLHPSLICAIDNGENGGNGGREAQS